jgi:hypothetical protein
MACGGSTYHCKIIMWAGIYDSLQEVTSNYFYRHPIQAVSYHNKWWYEAAVLIITNDAMQWLYCSLQFSLLYSKHVFYSTFLKAPRLDHLCKIFLTVSFNLNQASLPQCCVLQHFTAMNNQH